MATTTNFGWDTPDDTDYVAQGAAAMRELGQDIDTTLVDLKGGTTGQILTKNSNTDMDFIWSTAAPGDITGVTATSPLTGGGTSGDVTIGIASTAVVPSQTGNSGKYLTTDGTTSSWGSISAGGMTLLSTTSMSGSSQINLTSINQTYKDLVVLINNTTWNTSMSEMRMYFNALNIAVGAGQYGTTNDSFTNDQIKFTLANNTDNTVAQTHYCLIKNYASTTAFKPFNFNGISTNTTGSRRASIGAGATNSTDAITSLRFETAHANSFNAGTILLYGVN